MQGLGLLLQAPELSSAEDFWEAREPILPQVSPCVSLGQDAQQCLVQNWTPQPMSGQQELPNYILMQF